MKRSDGNGIVFVPHLDFLSSGKFKFSENEYNVSPFSKSISRANQITVSLTSVAAVCNVDRDQIGQSLKEVFVKFVSAFF